MREWSCCGRPDFIGLDTLAKFLGVGEKSSDCDGARFAELFAGSEAERETALEYLRNDVAITKATAEKIGLI
jgi:hypothetical protein